MQEVTKKVLYTSSVLLGIYKIWLKKKILKQKNKNVEVINQTTFFSNYKTTACGWFVQDFF